MTNVARSILTGMRILVGQQWVTDKAIVVEEGRIKTIIADELAHNHLPAKKYEFPSDYVLIPGLIDLHIHGTHGHDVMDATPDALHAISHALAREGVTGFLATTMSAPANLIEAALKNIAITTSDELGADILGVHLEGPFIAKAKCGAQCADYILPPDVRLWHEWQKIANETIKIVTVAPEVPGALDLIAALRRDNVIASVGHTKANYVEGVAAIAAGCTQATHLFNAMSMMHQREPGAITALLLSSQIIAELIVDGVHVHPAIIELAYRTKGKEGLLLVSDAMRAKCLRDGEYELGGQAVHVTNGRAQLADGTLAGSTLTMPTALKNMVAFSRCPLADAVYMASSHPAKVLGLSARKGSIAVGKDADLVVMDADFNVHLTMREGKEIYKS